MAKIKLGPPDGGLTQDEALSLLARGEYTDKVFEGLQLAFQPLSDWLKDGRNQAPIEWLIQPYLPLNRTSLFVSNPGVGKSMFWVALMLASVTGKKFLGYRLPKLTWGYLCYDAPENQTNDYFRRLMYGFDIEEDDEALAHIRLLRHNHPAKYQSFHEADGEDPRFMNLIVSMQGCDAVVIDCFADAFSGGDENDAGEVTAFFTTLHQSLQFVGVQTIILLHHEPKNSTGGTMLARGSTAISGKPRAMVRLTHNRKTGLYRLTREKPRGFDDPIEYVVENFDELGDVVGQNDMSGKGIRFINENRHDIVPMTKERRAGRDQILDAIRKNDGKWTKTDLEKWSKDVGMARDRCREWRDELKREGKIDYTVHERGRTLIHIVA